MAEFVSLWAARSTKKRKRKAQGREHKRIGLFSKGIDFYTDSGTPTIRDCGE